MRKAIFNLTTIMLLTGMIASCSSTSTPLSPTATPLPPTATPTTAPTLTPTTAPTVTPTVTEVPKISDIEFAEKAQNTCDELKDELDQIIGSSDTNKSESISEAYRQAAETLGKLNFTDQSSPMGYKLQNGLKNYAQLRPQFISAYQKAIEESGVEKEGLLVAWDKEGAIFVHEYNSDEDWITLNIDNELVKEYFSIKEALEESADDLGLKWCSPAWLSEF
jgi:hypothetical protein